MIAARPIITSERKGPVQGSLVMGRFIRDELIKALAQQTRVGLHLHPVREDSVSPAERQILDEIAADAPYFIAEHPKLLEIYTTFPDLYGAPALLLRADMPRNITAAGSVTMGFAVISTLIVGIILLIVLLTLLQRIVIKPVSDLTRHAVRIRDRSDLSLRYVADRADEIGILAQEFDRMVSQLHAVHQGLETLVAERTADLEAVNRRLKLENADRRGAEIALQKARDDLERQVEARTAELRIANAQLQREVEDHRRSEEQLRRYHDKLRSLSSELILTEERERRRIATELHDRIGQALTISKLKMDTLAESEALAGQAPALDGISNLIEQTIQDARLLTFELSPPVLYELGLEAALEWLLEQIQEQYGLTTEFSDDRQPKPLDYAFRVLIFQATRELLFNVVKHAQAREVNVSIQKEGDTVRIEIEDNGVGFDPENLNAHPTKNVGFGLFSIRERLRHLGGRLEIASARGKGTRVTLVSPLKQAAKIVSIVRK
ncbi:MAG: HAMP domain-containing protein [Desulfobacterales bacterium]|nr:MAG: HAMP domain-containing protein [Desulfobacterales bacterium]